MTLQMKSLNTTTPQMSPFPKTISGAVKKRQFRTWSLPTSLDPPLLPLDWHSAQIVFQNNCFCCCWQLPSRYFSFQDRLGHHTILTAIIILIIAIKILIIRLSSPGKGSEGGAWSSPTSVIRDTHFIEFVIITIVIIFIAIVIIIIPIFIIFIIIMQSFALIRDTEFSIIILKLQRLCSRCHHHLHLHCQCYHQQLCP